MADVTQLIDDYIAVWNEGDAGHRRELVARVFTAGGEKIATGHDYGQVAPDGRLRAVTGFVEQ
jgi:hypothetical protein